MEREEWEATEICAICGAQLADESVTPFVFGTDTMLCAECATLRGGRYDAERDLWEAEPDLTGLVDRP